MVNISTKPQWVNVETGPRPNGLILKQHPDLNGLKVPLSSDLCLLLAWQMMSATQQVPVDYYTVSAWWQLVDSNHVGLTHWPLGNLNEILNVIFKQILVIDGWSICCEIALIWMSLDFTDDQLTLVQVMAWCHQATSHYLSQCWPRSLLPYGTIRPLWVNSSKASQCSIITALTRLKLTSKLDVDLIIGYDAAK